MQVENIENQVKNGCSLSWHSLFSCVASVIWRTWSRWLDPQTHDPFMDIYKHRNFGLVHAYCYKVHGYAPKRRTCLGKLQLSAP